MSGESQIPDPFSHLKRIILVAKMDDQGVSHIEAPMLTVAQIIKALHSMEVELLLSLIPQSPIIKP